MSDAIADFFLFFSHFEALLSILLLILLRKNKKLFFQTICISSFNIVLNVALKGTFKVPLNASLAKIGYAFPSGHMQLSSVFYLWLALQIDSKFLRLIIAPLLLGIASGLIHFNYHNLEDVLAGFVVGLLLIASYDFTLKKSALWAAILLLSLSSLLMIYNYLIYAMIPIHAIYAYCVLLVCIFIERMVDSGDPSSGVRRFLDDKL